jgi:hypothetical protein
MKLPRNYCGILGFDALVYRDKHTVYVTHLESGTTHSVSLVSDIDIVPANFQDVADVIADRIASSVSADIAVYSLQSWESVSPDCPVCGI